MRASMLRDEFNALEEIHLKETIREVREGDYHFGKGAVVQFLGKKIIST